MTEIVEIGAIEYERSQRERWIAGDLVTEWARRYGDFPEFVSFFDADFDAFAEKHKRFKAERRPYGFYETLAGILLCHATGYRPMFSEPGFRFSPSKQEIVDNLIDPRVLDVITDQEEFGATQAPDLLMYKSDPSDWFFCEVKGLRDELGEKQRSKFSAIARASGKPIRVLRFEEVPSRAV